MTLFLGVLATRGRERERERKRLLKRGLNAIVCVGGVTIYCMAVVLRAVSPRSPISPERSTPGFNVYARETLFAPCANRRGGGEGRTRLLLDLVLSPLTTHPFRDGAPFLLLTETPPTFGCLFTLLPRITHKKKKNVFCLSYLLFSLAVCGHHLSPRILS